MTSVRETTMVEFQVCLEKHRINGKGGITLCYRGLSRRDQMQARGMIRSERDRERQQARAAQLRLDIIAATAHTVKANRWDEVLSRLPERG